jgi:hypothetical protein
MGKTVESDYSNEDGSKRRDELVQKLAVKPGYKGKIEAMCVHCIWDPYSTGSWRLQIQKCTFKGCPLYSVRPQASYKENKDG